MTPQTIVSEVRRGLPESDRGTQETYETPDPRTHYAELDALRGIAIIGVVLTHVGVFWFAGARQPLLVPFLRVDLVDYFNLGYLGVTLFFLLSGYLLSWTEGKRVRRGSYDLLSYAKRRALRLVPAYYAAIVLVVVVWPTSPTYQDIALLFTFLQGFKPSLPLGLDPAVWSLTPEVVFYVMLPFLVLKFRSFPWRLVILGILAAVSIATRLLMANGFFDSVPVFGSALAGNRMYFYPTTLLYLFLVGVLLRMMVERIETGGGSGPRLRAVALISTVVPVVVLAGIPLIVGRRLLVSPLELVAEAMVILFFAAALLGSPLLKPVLGLRPLMFVGKISYSLFLLHMTVVYLTVRYVLFQARSWLATQDGATVWAFFTGYAFFVIVASLILAYLSFRYIESPFLRRKAG